LQDAQKRQAHNTDFDRFGYPEKTFRTTHFLKRIKGKARAILRRGQKPISESETGESNSDRDAVWDGKLEDLTHLYDQLSDDCSRRLLVDLVAYRLLGADRVRLPLNNAQFWNKRDFLKSLFELNDTLSLPPSNWILARVDLARIGFPIKLYSNAIGIHTIFELKQYEYSNRTPGIKAEKGDVVLDAGACWGDTALYFANEVQGEGKVYSFEFIPGNLGIMRKNIDLNPELKGRIEIVERPVWSKTGETLHYQDAGPGSRVGTQAMNGATVSTITIDDFAKENGVQQVDFIKMDIEGAELSALTGAVDVIRKYRPKLAISIYHSVTDFVSIPKFILSLNANYEFYLGHYTIYAEETVLFCSPRKPGIEAS
jgi:FkbM family methyltransferase